MLVVKNSWGTSWGEHGYVRLLRSTRTCAGESGISSGSPSFPVVTRNLVPLSEQQFVDCDTTDSFCYGGLMFYAFAFSEKNAICTEGGVVGFTWGTSWGQHDYVRLFCSTRACAGECGILSGPPSFPVETGNLVLLSVQQFVDCDMTDPGCNGELMDYDSICTEGSYPWASLKAVWSSLRTCPLTASAPWSRHWYNSDTQ